MAGKPPTRTTQMLQIYGEFTVAVYARDAATVRRLTTPGFTVVNPRQQDYDFDAFIANLDWLNRAVADFGEYVQIHETVAGPDMLIIRHTTTYHERASGKEVTYGGVEWVRFDGAQISEIRAYYDWPHGLTETL